MQLQWQLKTCRRSKLEQFGGSICSFGASEWKKADGIKALIFNYCAALPVLPYQLCVGYKKDFKVCII